MRIRDYHSIFINLDKDSDKKERVTKILTSLNVKHTRQEAVYGKSLENKQYRDKIARLFKVSPSKLDIEFWMNRSNFKTMTKYKSAVLPKVGAYLSHTLAIKKAIDMGLDKVLILEDDMDPLENVNQPFSIPANTDIFYLGGSFWGKDDSLDVEKPYVPINGQQLKMVGGFAYIIPTRSKMIEIYNVLMSVFNEGKSHDKHKDWRTGIPKMRAQAIDLMYVNHFQKNGRCFIVNPVRISHKELGSNIQNNRRKYNISHFLTDTHKKQIKPLFQ